MRNRFTLAFLTAVVLAAGMFCAIRISAQARGERGQAAGQRGGRGNEVQPPLWLPDEDFVRWPCLKETRNTQKSTVTKSKTTSRRSLPFRGRAAMTATSSGDGSQEPRTTK